MNPEQLDFFDNTLYPKIVEPQVPVVSVKKNIVKVVRNDNMRLSKLAADIRLSTEVEDIGYLPLDLCQVWFPRSRPKGLTFERKNGNVMIKLEAGKLAQPNGTWEQQNLPYGAYPRLFLIDLITQAKLTKTPEIDLGKHLRPHLIRLGIDISGHGYRYYRQHINAFSVCSMTIARFDNDILTQFDAKLIDKFQAWIVNEGNQEALFSGKIWLTPQLFKYIMAEGAVIPVNMQAVVGLRKSPLAMDMYCCFTQRAHRVKKDGGSLISWPGVRNQFGIEYNSVKNFRRDFLAALIDVKAAYPELKFKVENEGFRIFKSRTPVPMLLEQ
jgi:hypothetical protein